MSNTRSNIDYIQLCKALEEGDKVTAENLILNNVNVNTFDENYRYIWANIVYEALEISIISKVLQDKDKVIEQNLLLNDNFYPNLVNTPRWKRTTNILLQSLNRFKRIIRSPTYKDDEITAQKSVLININNNYYSKSTCQPPYWVNSIFTILKMFSKLFYNETLGEEDKLVKSVPNWNLDNNNLNHPNATEFQKWTKIISETLDITIKRLNNSLNIHARNHNYYKLLNIAIQKNNTLEACLFMRKGARLGDTQIFEDLIVFLLGAIEQNNDIIAKVLIDHGMEYNPQINLIIPLNVAISQEQSKIIEHISPNFQFLKLSNQYIYKQAVLSLEEEAKKQLQIPGNRYMFDSIKNGYCKAAQLFLDYNSNVQYISSCGDTALFKAIENDFDMEFIKSLLKLGLPVNIVNHEMLTPLLVTCKTKSVNQFDIVTTLLQYNANVNCADRNSMTPLHFACQAENLDIVKVLLEKGANPNVKNHEGQTPLHLVYELKDAYYVSSEEKSDIILNITKLLVQHNADIEAVDSKGWTPLFRACKGGHEAAVKYLLENHANVSHTDLDNLNCLYIVMDKSFNLNIKVVELLLKYKINVHCVNKLGKSIIHHVVERDNRKLIKCFAYMEINFNSVDKQGNTPLYIAIKHRRIGMIKSLLKYGVDINILDRKKRTPFQTAINYVSYHRKKLNNYSYLQQWYRSDFDSDEERTNESLQRVYTAIHIHTYKKIVRILKMHIMKLKTAGLKVNKQNLNLYYNSDNYVVSDDESSEEDYISDTEHSTMDIVRLEVECTQEIEKMRMERIGVSHMTLYDFLTKNIHLLCRWVKNKDIQKILESRVYDGKFPLYINIIKSRFRDAKFRYRLMNPAKKYFSLNICQRLPDDCVDTVFSYLKIKEINMFIRAVKGLD